jgi:hypothetical protein
MPVPDTELRISLDPGENIELLIFQDAPFAYLVQELKKLDCNDCLDRNSLRQLIFDENPNLHGLLAARDWENVLLTLLSWSSQQVDQGETSRTTTTGINALRVQDLTYFFRNDEIEGSCGLFAVYFAKILSEFGYRAVTLDFGLTHDQLSHVTTVVKAPDDRFYFVDPTFNAVYRDPRGNLVDVETALRSREARFTESPIVRDALFNAEQFSNWQGRQFFRDKGYDFQACSQKAVAGKAMIFCPDMPYSSLLLKEVWASRLLANEIGSDADLFRSLLTKGKVFSVGYQDPKLREELTLLLRKAGLSFAQ